MQHARGGLVDEGHPGKEQPQNNAGPEYPFFLLQGPDRAEARRQAQKAQDQQSDFPPGQAVGQAKAQMGTGASPAGPPLNGSKHQAGGQTDTGPQQGA